MMMQTVTSAALQQQESVSRHRVETLDLADSSKAAFTDQNDPVNPFTLFGTTRYKPSSHFALQHAKFLTHHEITCKQAFAGLAGSQQTGLALHVCMQSDLCHS